MLEIYDEDDVGILLDYALRWKVLRSSTAEDECIPRVRHKKPLAPQGSVDTRTESDPWQS